MIKLTRYQWTVFFAAWLGWGFDIFDGLLFNFVAPNAIPTLLGLPIGGPEAKQALPYWTGILNSLLLLGQIRYKQGNLEDARKLVSRYNKLVEPTAESLWLALRVERKLGERVAEAGYANQLRRRFNGSREYQLLQRGEYD